MEVQHLTKILCVVFPPFNLSGTYVISGHFIASVTYILLVLTLNKHVIN